VRFGQNNGHHASDLAQVIEVNLTGAFLGIRAVASSMRKAGGGAIVNISSGAGFTQRLGSPRTCRANGPCEVDQDGSAGAWHDNIRVNSIHPGAIRTPLLADHAPDAAAMAATWRRRSGVVRDSARCEPEEITRLVLFVASDDASFSTGSEFIADGGLLLGPVPASRPRAEAAAMPIP